MSPDLVYVEYSRYKALSK